MPVDDNRDEDGVIVDATAPYDPRGFRPTSTGLPASSDSPQDLPEPHQEEEAQTDVSDPGVEAKEPLPEFDPRWQKPLEGLLFLGALSRTFYWCGHKFKIRTITHGDMLEVGQISAQYESTQGDLRAYMAAIVAACIVEVDDKVLTIPLTNEPRDSMLSNKFDYINHNWFAPVIDVVYDQYLGLETTVAEVLNAMDQAAPLGVPASE